MLAAAALGASQRTRAASFARFVDGTTRSRDFSLRDCRVAHSPNAVAVGETPKPGLFDVFRSRKMLVLFLLGFSSGVPLLLTGQTLQAWMEDAGVKLGAIADLSAVGLAYTFKFAWAPLLDRYRLPFLGRRRGWCFALQLALAIAIAAMGMVDPLREPLLLAAVAVTVAFLSASLDVIIDAYKADILAPTERAAGSAAYVLGYRTALIFTGTIALILADHIPWRVVYGAMATLMSVGVIATLLAPEPGEPRDAPRTLIASIVRPFSELFRRLGWRTLALLVGFAALYRFGDYFAQTLTVPFLKRIGFSNTEVGIAHKSLGYVGTLVGGLVSAALVARHGARKLLVPFAALAALTNLLYMLLAIVGPDYVVFWSAVIVDHVTTALATTVFLAVLMGATTAAVSATQFALLTSTSSVGQRVFGFLTDDVVTAWGWPGFFAVTVLLAIPGALLAWLVARHAKIEM
jgi:MFS transporter, PAT family, beta-lactamase induction signal transducer AmpG